MTYGSEAAFRAALNAKISAVARQRRWARDDIARAVALQLFVGRLFRSSDADRWILTGGTALQFRAPTYARPTRDADLATSVAGDELRHALVQAVAPQAGEFGEFTVTVVPSRTPGLYAGCIQFLVDGKRVAAATLDLSHRDLLFSPDKVVPDPVVVLDGLPPLPPIRINSVPDALADKIAAMYELHGSEGTTPSTRYHDLVDLLIITTTERVTAADLRAAIAEQERRRDITIPVPLILPGPLWARGYSKAVQRSGLPADLHSLPAAMRVANTCLQPLLSRATPDDAEWNPTSQRWSIPGTTSRKTIARLLSASRRADPSRSAEPIQHIQSQQLSLPASPPQDLRPGLDP